MRLERPLCVSLDGFTLHAATRAGGFDEAGREALLKYILRPAVAQERITLQPDGLISPVGDHEARHTVRYAGALGAASKLRARLVPKPVAAAHEVTAPSETPHEQTTPRRRRVVRRSEIS